MRAIYTIRKTTALLLLALLGMWPGFAPAVEMIAVPNGSFELPDTGYVSINIDHWEKVPKPSWYQETGVYKWNQLTGLFENPSETQFDHIDNLHGGQGMWLFAVPEVAIYQDYDTRDWNDTVPTRAFNAKYEVGKAYTLTVALAGYGGGMKDGVKLQLALYYRGTAGQMVIVSSTVVENTFERFPDNYHLQEFKVQVPAVKPGDPWANKNIGIRFLSLATTANEGGYWDLDNVRLTAEVPPPPVKVAMVGTDVRVSWVGAAAYRYQVEACTEFGGDWLPAGAVLTGAGAELSRSFALAGFPARFFRVVVAPP